MNPPIFSQPPTGTLAQQHMHRARMFRDAAMRLPDYSNGEQYWPKYALLTHAIELSADSDESGQSFRSKADSDSD